ncbi:hypothetical protein SEA_KARDASHIAN_45 [Streptomyces phage Kardashian]|nr:hypothetical protein SEA_KARDASHIAN_45 [Streptomyces phage Kardashian]
MNLTPLLKRMGKVAADNSPAILTAIGVTGAVAATYLAARGGMEAVGLLKEAEENKKTDLGEGFDPDLDGALTFEEKFNATWKCFAPAVGCLVLSATAVICSNRVSDRRTAAMASAYSVVKESYAEYRAKNVEKVGKKKEQELRDEIAQDRRNNHPIDKTMLIVTGKGPTLVYDKWNDRYFTSSRNEIDAAVNEVNRQINIDGFATMTEFYRLLKVPAAGHSDYLGWNIHNPLEVAYSGTLGSDGDPCLQVEFRSEPDPKFDQSY